MAYSQKPVAPLTRILFILDYSNSMTAYWGKERKVDVARRLLIKLVDSLDKVPNIQMALRMYGHQSPVPPQDCNDTKLEVPFADQNAFRIKQKLITLEPKGTTPIARSLELCANDFPPMVNCRNIVILITDGIEACNGDPCAIAINLYKKGIVLKPFVIGIGLDVELKKAFECMGEFFDADKEDRFEQVLDKVITEATNLTSAQINLLNTSGKPNETDVNMTFYNNASGEMLFNSIHTLNQKGNPDTLILDPNINYKIDIHTIPQLTIENYKPIAGKHNIISKDAAQGFLLVSGENNGNEYIGTKLIVRKRGEGKTLNIQEFFKKEKYLIGKYDLELLTLPRLYFNDVEIKQSDTKTISVPQPGLVTMNFPSESVGSIYVMQKNTAKWIYNLNNITREVLNLQPGKYLVVYRPKNAKLMSFSSSKEFEVESGRSIMIKF